ncbi:DUF4856 domain-containing protein [Rapidithrix thailandica]|uniref:DUF4856 domain-containing protein n=1 Tax=Rapidithrix thailandica TaxID=413964 RepID=A0AAW9S0D7_9BACT
MKKYRLSFLIRLLSVGLVVLTGCKDSDPEPEKQLEVPTSYVFNREGTTTVSYTGQIDRLDMLTELKAYINKGDKGEVVQEQTLLDMFANENNPFSTEELNSSTKQIKNKVSGADLDENYFENLFKGAAEASAAGKEAAEGVAGLIERATPGKNILVDANGHEYTQFVEKGLMGSLIFHQIFNTYLTDDRTGDDVENVTLVEDKNYTLMEHHWDEAFGYFGVPVDFPTTTTGRFWGKYCNEMDAAIGSNKALMDAFLTGRAAIVANDFDVKNVQKLEIYKNLELVAAATAIHYLNETKSAINAGEQGEAFHTLSEGFMFIRALKYSPKKRISIETVNAILNEKIGVNFWQVTPAKLDAAKVALVEVFTELESVKDQL